MIHETYKPSGKFHPCSVAVLATGVFISSVVLGIGYTYLIDWVPYAKLRCIITALYTGSICITVHQIIKLGHIRNPQVAAIVALLSGGAGYYLHWCFFAAHFHHKYMQLPLLDTYNYFLKSPSELGEFISALYDKGHFSTGSTNVLINGAFLGFIWASETMVITCGPALYALITSPARTLPYSESSKRWFTEYQTDDCILIKNKPDEIKTYLSSETTDKIQLSIGTPEATSTIRLFSCETEPETHYISINQTTKRTRGKWIKFTEAKVEAVVTLLKISPKTRESFLQILACR